MKSEEFQRQSLIPNKTASEIEMEIEREWMERGRSSKLQVSKQGYTSS